MPTVRIYFTAFHKPLAIVFSIVILFVALINVFVPSALAVTGINRTINFQGKLVNASGLNVANGNYSVVFSFYDISSGGAALWSETQSVTTTDGIFRVALGSSTAIPATFNFNWDGIYLGIKVESDSEMTPRVRMAAVPYSFNAEKVAGLTVQDTSGNASTSGTLKVANASTLTFPADFTISGANALTLATSGITSITLPTGGTLLTNATSANQTITSTQSTGTVLGITDSTALTGVIKGAVITLSGSGVQDQTGLEFNLSNASGSNLNDIVGTTGSWKVSKAGVLTVASCSGCGAGGGSSNWTLDTFNGVLRPNNNTVDFLLGSTATIAAKFAVLNLSTGTPVASVAGTFSLGSDAGTIRTIGATAKNSLQLGDANTGHLLFSPNNALAMTITTAGNVSIANSLSFGTNNLSLTGTTISTSGNNSNLTLAPNGSGDLITTLGDAGQFAINATPTTDVGAQDSVKVTLNPTITGSTQTLQGVVISQSDNANTGVYDTLLKLENLKTPETTTNGLFIQHNAASGTMSNAINITNTAGTLTNGIQLTGTFATALFDSPTLDITAAGNITGVAASITGATNLVLTPAAASSLTLGTTGGGNTTSITLATDSTGDAEIVLPAQSISAGEILNDTITSTQLNAALTFSALDFVDLAAIVHNTTANQGLRLPNAASATPSNPTSGEGYLAWDSAGNQIISYNGTAWSTLSGGGGYNLIKDESTSLTARTTLAFLGAGVTCADNVTQTECTIAAGGAGPWTDGAGITYLTDTAESLAIGTTSIADFGTKLQVGSATNRGDIAVYGGIVKKGLTNQKALANVSDVFVYDTTRDSDGGRWTEAQSSRVLSWYTEAKDDGLGDACVIATDDRCGQSSFPKKAIIASTADGVYIFDSDDNSMWIKFTQSGGTFALGADTNNNPSSVFALNGVLYVGTNGASGTGLYAFDFVTNRMYRYNTTNRVESDKDISQRNTAVTYATDARTFFALVDNLVNDVHASVLSGSASILTNGGPLNGATFIAAATDAGISVINLSSGRTLDYADVAADDYDAVFLTRRGRLYGLNETQAQVERWGAIITAGVGIDVDNADQATPTKFWDEVTSPARLFNSAVTFVNTAPDALEVVERGSFAELVAAAGGGDILYVGHSAGMTEIHDTNAANAATIQPWSKYYTTAYQTNYMPATIKAMFPMNEASGDLTGQAVNSFALSLQPKGTPTYNVDGVHGTGVTFNGTNAFFCSDSNANDGTCDNDADYNVGTTAFHIQAWFKHSTTQAGTDVLINKMYNTTPARVAGWGIEMNATGNIVFGIRDDAAAGWGDSVTSTLAFNDGQWHHVVAVNTDTALCLYIDGKLAVACDVALAETLTLDGAATFLSIGADCSVGAACATGANFWDGSIDDVQISAGGATTTDSLSQAQVVRMYLEGRNAMPRRTAIVTDATSGSANTIADTGEAWLTNEFAGQIVEITGGTGVNQSRRIVSNTATTLTVTPNWTVNPDTTSDFAIDPERIHGTAARVQAIGSFDPVFVGESRRLYVGTNDGSDGGSVTVFEGMGTTSLTDIYHSDAKKLDDASAEWTGTDRDDIQAIGANGRMVALGSLAGTWTETASHRLEENFDKLNNQIAQIRLEMIHDVLGASSHEIGGMGADLAEWYGSGDQLAPGEVVTADATQAAHVKRSERPYQQDILGVVATMPAITLGEYVENSYPIALVGRVPVNVSTESGKIKTGDRISSSSVPGVAMKATKAGRVLGTALESYEVEDGSIGQILVFVNLTDFLGEKVEFAMEQQAPGLTVQDDGLLGAQFGRGTDRQQEVLAFLQATKQHQAEAQSEIFTDRVSVAFELVTPQVVTDTLFAKVIKADRIEGLELLVSSIQYGTASKSSVLSASASAANVILSETKDLDSPPLAQNDNGMLTLVGLEVNGLATVSGALRVKENGFFESLLTVIDTITTNNFIASGLSTFFGDVIFKENVDFAGRPTFNKDTAGFATIKKDADRVEVTFEKEYEQLPVITASLTFDEFTKEDGTPDDQEERKKKLFEEKYSFVVTKRSAKGFTISLNKKASEHLIFSWAALSVKDPKKFESARLQGETLEP